MLHTAHVGDNDDRPFHPTGLPDETPADLADAMEFFLANQADELSEIELEELALREQERELSAAILAGIDANRAFSAVLAELFPALAA